MRGVKISILYMIVIVLILVYITEIFVYIKTCCVIIKTYVNTAYIQIQATLLK